MFSGYQNGVEIIWDGVSPSESDIAHMSLGAALATEALAYIGVPQTTPKSMVIGTNPNPDSAISATAEDARTFKVYVNKVSDLVCLPNFNDVVRFICHERIHTDRFEYFHRNDEVNYSLAERIVHEGLATYGEQTAMKSLLTPVEHAGIYSSRVTDSLGQSLVDAYLRDNEALLVERHEHPDGYMSHAVAVLTQWHERAGQTRNTKVSLLGMVIVGNLVENGESLLDLIKMPSQQIITNGMMGI